ncbi:hypothetical protein [Mesorhizobium sp. M0768]|uniref:hypothetical protein n=1 Tax=Mesorhizobium sp. M0768 TaxID=2956996 RepID=UPI00333C654D
MSDVENITAPTPWEPKFHLDLKTANSGTFYALVDQFEEWRKTRAENEDKLANGWHIITSEMAEGLLLKNPAGSNRKAVLANIVYYAEQMAAEDWPETGQPLIFDVDGKLLDGQHRLWACYLSGVPFATYVVNQRKPIKSAFAYIDNVKARTAKDALATAGLNGLSALTAQTVMIAQLYENKAYTATKKHRLPRMSPKQFIDYVEANPNIRRGAQLMAGEHASASAMIGHNDVAAFAAVKILDLHDEFTLDEFMNDVGSEGEEFGAGSPIAGLQHVLKLNSVAKEPMQKHQVLAHVIKAFNAWMAGEQVKKISLRVDETFPRFMPKQAEAA